MLRDGVVFIHQAVAASAVDLRKRDFVDLWIGKCHVKGLLEFWECLVEVLFVHQSDANIPVIVKCHLPLVDVHSLLELLHRLVVMAHRVVRKSHIVEHYRVWRQHRLQLL